MSDCKYRKDEPLWCLTHKAGVLQANGSECAEILSQNLSRVIGEVAKQAMEIRDLRLGLDDLMRTSLQVEKQRDDARDEVERLKAENAGLVRNLDAIVKDVRKADLQIKQAVFALGRFEVQGCPCGARPESPTTHPHVTGCHVDEAIVALEGRGQVPIGDA